MRIKINFKNKALATAAAALMLLTACSSQINYERISLALEVNPEVYTSDVLTRVEIAPDFAVQSGGMLMKISEVQIVESTNFRYAGSLQNELKLLFASELITSGLDKGEYFYRVNVSQFWGTLAGTAEVGLSLKIIDKAEDKVIFAASKTASLDLQEDGYAQLALKLKAGFISLSSMMLKEYLLMDTQKN